MAKRITDSTPKTDGFRMPAEFEPQDKIWMIWPERTDNWRDGAKPAQQAYAIVAKAISAFEPVNMLVSSAQYANCRNQLPPEITVIEMSTNDALALEQIQSLFPDRKAVGVLTREIVYGGGNIHCITQQQPAISSDI